LTVNAFGEAEDCVGVDIAGEAKNGVAVYTGVLEVYACTAILADYDLHFVIPAICTSADLDAFDDFVGTAEHVGAELGARLRLGVV